MERSRSKRSYGGGGGGGGGNHHHDRQKRRYTGGGGGGNGGGNYHHRNQNYQENLQENQTFSTSFRILCPEIKAGGVIGKGGEIVKTLQEETGAWINIHPVAHGDDERIIEISDIRVREPDGSISPYSPAREALLMINDRILHWDNEPSSLNRVTTRLVVPRPQVGCLMGKGGKIIEQMRMETGAHIRILPKDHQLPQCASPSDEIVQVFGEATCVKAALGVISTRLKDTQMRDRNNSFHNRALSPEPPVSADDDFQHFQGPSVGPRPAFGSSRNSMFSSRPSRYDNYDSAANHLEPSSMEEIVLRILCPEEKVESIFEEDGGLIGLLQTEVGVNVKVAEPLPGYDERVLIVSSEEDPDDCMFPAQEALLHIQSHMVDLVPEKQNLVRTRLLIPAREITCLMERDDSLLEMSRLTNADIKILPRHESQIIFGSNQIVQIVGEIRAARAALLEVTSRLRSKFLSEASFSTGAQPSSLSINSHMDGIGGHQSGSTLQNALTHAAYQENEPSPANFEGSKAANMSWLSPKEMELEAGRSIRPDKIIPHKDVQNAVERFPAALVTRTTIEVVLPEHATSALTRSTKKLLQIGEISGAKVSRVENEPGMHGNIIQISGTPEQAEKAQNLLQGFILSIELDDDVEQKPGQ